MKLLSILVFSTRLITGCCHGGGIVFMPVLHNSLVSLIIQVSIGSWCDDHDLCGTELSRARSTVTQARVEADD